MAEMLASELINSKLHTIENHNWDQKMNANRITKVVVVYDKGSRGKSTVLRMLCQQLLVGKTSADYQLWKPDAYNDLANPPNGIQENKPDVMLAVKHEGKLVGVGTAGDVIDVVLRNFMFFDKWYPELNFDVVFVAVRKQERRDGLGDCGRSFPLIVLEDFESRFDLNVIRPFVSINYQTNKPSAGASQQAKDAFLQRCVAANTQTVQQLFQMI